MTKAILPKGSSCSTCKARKVRCDAIRPACTACKRSARFRHENPDEVECCYTTTRRSSKREDGVLAKERIEKRNAKGKGKEVVSTSDEEDPMGSGDGSSSSSCMSPSITSKEHLSSDRDTWTTPLPPFSYPTRSESDPSRSLPSYDSTASTSSSPIDDFSFPLDLPVLSSTSLPLSSEYFPLANDMLFESSSSFYPALSVSPSKLSTPQLLIPRQDFDASYSYAQQDPFLSSPSSISSSTYSSSLSSLDPSDHPFALADELSFYHSDSSVPPSPPFSPSIEPAKENFDFSHCFLPDANGFESLTLPLFQPYPSGPAW